VSTRLHEAFARARTEDRAALITFATVGYPALEETPDIVHALVEGGSDIVELGIPFSDPLADGATIQHASQVALEQGATVEAALALVQRLRREGTTVPLLFMGYYNPFYQYGLERLVKEASTAGLDGFIVPDLPPEEAAELAPLTQPAGLDMVCLLAPTSTAERIKLADQCGSGFIYCVSLTGVTGARDQLSATLPDFLARVRRYTQLPLAVGFGIARPEHVATVARLADGVVTASALINLIDRTPPRERTTALVDLVRQLRAATQRTPAQRGDEGIRGTTEVRETIERKRDPTAADN